MNGETLALYKRYLQLLRLPAGASREQIDARFRTLAPAHTSFRIRVFNEARAFLLAHEYQGQAWCRTNDGLRWEWNREPYRDSDRARRRELRRAQSARAERQGWEAIRPEAYPLIAKAKQQTQAEKPLPQVEAPEKKEPKAARPSVKFTMPEIDVTPLKGHASAAAKAARKLAVQGWLAFKAPPASIAEASSHYAGTLTRSKKAMRQSARKANRPFTRGEKRLAIAGSVFWVCAFLLAGRESAPSIALWKPSLNLAAPKQEPAPATPAAPAPQKTKPVMKQPKAPAQVAQVAEAPAAQPEEVAAKPAKPAKSPSQLARETIERNWPSVMQCLASIPKKRAYRGSATYRVSIVNGLTSSIEIRNDTLRYAVAHGCVTRGISAMDFGKIKSAVVDFKSGFELGSVAAIGR